MKQQATALKEKEFNLHHSNLMTIGTQAAVLAGLDVTMFIEFNPAHDREWAEGLAFIPRTLKFFYYIMIVSAFCANISVVAQTTLLSVMSASLALRGPDGSMMVATDGLYLERKSVFQAFAYGLAATISSVVLCVWLLISPEAAVICMAVTIYTAVQMYKKYIHVMDMFRFNEEETVDFEDLFNGPGALKVNNSRKDRRNGSSKRRKKYRRDDHYSDSDSASSSTSEEIEQSNHSHASSRVRNRKSQKSRYKTSDHSDLEHTDLEMQNVPPRDSVEPERTSLMTIV